MSKVKVIKIDDEEEFKKIKQTKVARGLTENCRDRYSKWVREIGVPKRWSKPFSKKIEEDLNQNITWVGKHRQYIYNWIQDEYVKKAVLVKTDGKYMYRTVRNMLNGFANALLAINKNKYKDMARECYLQSFKFSEEAQAEVEQQEMSDKDLQDFVPYNDLCAKRDEMAEIYEEAKNLKNKQGIKDHMCYIALCMNTYWPPLRLNLLNMKIWKGKEAPPDDEQQNYLWKKKKGDWVIVVNRDKVSRYDKKRGKRGEYALNEEVIEVTKKTKLQVTNGKKLMEVIEDSLESLPRGYLLIALSNYKKKKQKPMSEETYRTSIWWYLFNPRQLHCNLIRRAYVNHWYNIVNMNAKKEIAKRMRHSVQTANESYMKLNIDLDKLQPYAEQRVTLPRTSTTTTIIKKVDFFDPKEYAKKYREKHKPKLEKTRIIYGIN